MNRTTMRAFVISLAACYLSGCNVDDGPVIQGRVTLNGRPLPGAEVLFLPADKDPTKPAGIRTTSDDGTFAIVPDEDTGATLPPGQYVVVISKKVTRAGGNIPQEMREDLEQMEAAGMVRETLPAHYSREADTTLTAEIKPEANDLNFELKTS